MLTLLTLLVCTVTLHVELKGYVSESASMISYQKVMTGVKKVGLTMLRIRVISQVMRYEFEVS